MNSSSKKDFKPDKANEKRPFWIFVVSIFSGLTFLCFLLIIALFIPHPTTFQIFVFRVVLSLAAAAFGATIPGFLQIKLPLLSKGLISAGGALGLFVLIYNVNPPALFSGSELNNQVVVKKEKQSLSGTILDQNGEPLSAVTVTIIEFGVKGMTNDQGSFFFEVEAEKHSSVRLMAQKEGFATHRQDVTLGNVRLSFQMRRKP